jgi:large subunit ribosomal protein L2
MKLKKFKPVTSSKRNLIQLNKSNLSKIPLLKNKIVGIKNTAGRNCRGKITSYHKGGGHKKKYRIINFLRNYNSTGIVTSIEYDPFRTANIASVYDFLNRNHYYIISPKNLNIGNIIKSGENAEPKIGNSLPILKIPVGSYIHNISVSSNKKAQLSRAAGAFAQLIEKTSKFARLKLSSGEHRYVSIKCYATIGIVSNEHLFLTTIGKAGRNRWLNKRPTVRGVAMNPIDHPHGGATSGGRSSVTPWGKPTKNGKTSRSKNKLIISKRT